MKRNIFLLLVSAGIGFGLAEYALRQGQVLNEQWPNSSYWYKAKWLETHQRETTGNHMAPIDTFHPLYGWTLKPNLRNHTDFGYAVSSNSAGMRGTQEYALAKSGKCRILFIGDSFMFGECVADSQTIPALVQQLLPDAEVMNMGIHGWGIDQILLRFEEEGSAYKPDIVILGCLNDDLLRSHMWFRDYAKPYYVLKDSEMILMGVPVITPEQLLSQPRLKLLDFAMAKLDVAFNEKSNTHSDKLSDSLLQRLTQSIKACDALPVLLYLPWVDECKSNNTGVHPCFENLATKNKLTMINPIPILSSKIKADAVSDKDFVCHYSPAITKTIAQQVVDSLMVITSISK